MRKHHLLLIEDEDSVRFGFSRYLLKEGYLVREAHCIANARKQLSLRTFDGLILDLNLPDGDGLDLLTDLRKNNSEIVILVVSAAMNAASECFTRGADCFFHKPVSMQQLQAALEQLLRLKQL